MPESQTESTTAKRGAGVIPFAISEGRVHFLFQTTFSGRKAGYLIDFGGGVGVGEDERSGAIREFVEETETLYLAEDPSTARRSAASISKQITVVEGLFERTLGDHPDWWCPRASTDSARPKRWKTFFVEFPYRDVARLNREWEADTSGRFKKRRELFWVAADELLAIYQTDPQRLWKRVRQLEGAPEVIHAIRRKHEY